MEDGRRTTLEGHRALSHLGELARNVRSVAGSVLTHGATLPPTARLIDRHQVVRYSAETEAIALSKAEIDRPVAAASGFRRVGRSQWDRTRSRPTLVVTYEFDPPATIRRTISSGAGEARSDFAMDAVTMASAGYVPDRQDWRGTGYGPAAALGLGPGMAYGWSGPGIVEVSYRFDTELAGEPITAVVITDEHGSTGWWVLDP